MSILWTDEDRAIVARRINSTYPKLALQIEDLCVNEDDKALLSIKVKELVMNVFDHPEDFKERERTSAPLSPTFPAQGT